MTLKEKTIKKHWLQCKVEGYQNYTIEPEHKPEVLTIMKRDLTLQKFTRLYNTFAKMCIYVGDSHYYVKVF